MKEPHTGAAGALEIIFELRFVHGTNDSLRFGMPRRIASDARVESGTTNTFERGIEATRSFRMSDSGVVTIEGRVRVDVEHRRCYNYAT